MLLHWLAQPILHTDTPSTDAAGGFQKLGPVAAAHMSNTNSSHRDHIMEIIC